MQLPERGLELWRRAGARAAGDVAWLPRCPVSYLTPFTLLMVSWHLWLAEWGKTPLDFGCPPDELDPRYQIAMAVLKRESARVEREELERIKRER